MSDQEIIELLAAILIQREGGSLEIDGELARIKEIPEFKIKRGKNKITITLK